MGYNIYIALKGKKGKEEILFDFETREVHEYFKEAKRYEENTEYELAKSAKELSRELIKLRNILDEQRHEYHRDSEKFYRYDSLIDTIQRQLDKHTLGDELAYVDGEYTYYCSV